MRSHTPGPWLAEHDEQSGHYDIVANGSVVAQVHYVDNAPCPIGKADARLIATAPELFDALEALLNGSERHIFGDECKVERLAAYAAIAKATGQ